MTELLQEPEALKALAFLYYLTVFGFGILFGRVLYGR